MQADDAARIVASYLSGKRLAHSEGTAEVAAMLAAQLGLDADRLFAAGLLHDIAKPMPHADLLALAKELGLELDWIRRENKALLHAPVAAALLAREHGVTDRELLDAVGWHTTGNAGLGDFALVVYAADFLDPQRFFPDQKLAWQRFAHDFTDGLLYVCEYKLRRVIERRHPLAPESVAMYNELLARLLEPGHRPRPVVPAGKSA